MNFIKKRPKHTKGYSGQRNQNVQWSISSKMEWIEKTPNPVTQSNKVWKKNNLSSKAVLAESSKWRELRSLQRHQIKQWGIIFQIRIDSCLPLFPNQLQKSSSTDWGITHWTPNMPNTMAQRSIATEQCRKRWFTLSPLRLHIQHQSWIVRPRFRKLSIVRTIPKEAIQERVVQLQLPEAPKFVNVSY